jgi:zinc and cadmium transporter
MYYQIVFARIPILWLIIPVASTLAGGLVALRLQRFRPLLVAAGAGLLLGAAFLDLLPESLTLGLASGLTASGVLGVTLLSFLLFTALDLALEGGFERWRSSPAGTQASPLTAGRVGGAMLIFHSFRDGMAIGAAFAASHAAGYAVALGIAAHDFGDGMNTVILTTRGGRAGKVDYLFLGMDAIAPLLGGLLTVWWFISSTHTVVLLAVAAGFFLQIATSEFLPQIRQKAETPQWVLLGVVASGAAIIYAANVLML